MEASDIVLEIVLTTVDDTAVIEERLNSLRITLPNPPQSAGSYIPAVIFDKLVFVSGQIPIEGSQIKFKGKVGRDLSIDAGQQAARLCTINALAQLKKALGNLDRIDRILKVTGFVNCDFSFTDHPKVINGASDLLVEIFGEKGKHARSAVGVASLPLDSAVEIEYICAI
jgi:enamine deaminase RidA (YjgF/YER057c/UK114 family)